jgi:hypothetical protein
MTVNDGEQSTVLCRLTQDQVELIEQCLVDYRKGWQDRITPKCDPCTAEAIHRVVSEVDVTIAALNASNQGDK